MDDHAKIYKRKIEEGICMDINSIVNFKGYSYDFKGEIIVLNTTLNNVRGVFKEELNFDEDAEGIITIIKNKEKILESITAESIIQAIETESGKKIKKVKPVSVSFDFAEPDNEECSVDLYVKCGKLFGGFTAHIRVSNNGEIIKMVGLS